MATTIVEMLTTFDYGSIKILPNNSIVPYNNPILSALDTISSNLMHPITVTLVVALYWFLSDVTFVFIRDTLKLEPKGPFLQSLTCIHSLLLAVYSGWTCFNTVPLVLRFMYSQGIARAYCDHGALLWETNNFKFWVIHFYLSKYWEFADTWILILKGKTPPFLQTYHHAGIIFMLWGFIVTQNTFVTLITVCFNSFIHTMMYSYYAGSSLGYEFPWKRYLTTAQMIQLGLGNLLTTPGYFWTGCLTDAQYFMLASCHIYSCLLLYLFYVFYKKNYSTKKRN